MLEKEIQKQIIDYLESIGAYVVKVIRANKSGVPDLIVCLNGKFIGIEVKRKGKKNNVTELQKRHLQWIKESDGKAIVADGLDDIKTFLKENEWKK